MAQYNCATWGVTLDTSASVSCPTATSTAACKLSHSISSVDVRPDLVQQILVLLIPTRPRRPLLQTLPIATLEARAVIRRKKEDSLQAQRAVLAEELELSRLPCSVLSLGISRGATTREQEPLPQPLGPHLPILPRYHRFILQRWTASFL